MTSNGLADYRLMIFADIIKFYASRDEADAALRDVLSAMPAGPAVVPEDTR